MRDKSFFENNFLFAFQRFETYPIAELILPFGGTVRNHGGVRLVISTILLSFLGGLMEHCHPLNNLLVPVEILNVLDLYILPVVDVEHFLGNFQVPVVERFT